MEGLAQLSPCVSTSGQKFCRWHLPCNKLTSSGAVQESQSKEEASTLHCTQKVVGYRPHIESTILQESEPSQACLE